MFWRYISLTILMIAITLLSYLSQEPVNNRTKRQIRIKDDFICGYESCPIGNPNALNIHLVAHSHDDVGWLKTVDQYYYGINNEIQKAGVQYIIDSVIDSLLEDETKKFIYVETAYFWKWLSEQNSNRILEVRRLIINGQLEIAGGAWSMNDEAAAHYHSIIDQFTWGLRRLNDTFGQCAQPKIGWQIDPFGHSQEMASLLAQMGFDGLFLGRIDYEDKMNRKSKQTLEMIWKASKNLGSKSSIFTGVLYNLYQPPPGFCFDILCRNEPINDNPESLEYNVEDKARDFISYAKGQSMVYQTNHIMFTMGGDFTYQVAHIYFKNLDRLIKYIRNNYESIAIYYSTPSCYLKALHESNKMWPTKSDDFFPYASDSNSYWTGYFTSRPTQKYLERKGNNLLQVTKQLTAITDFGTEHSADKKEGLIALREAMGIMQHHDAITGTEKQHVANDYARILSSAMVQSAEIASDSINKIMTSKVQNYPPPKLELTQCSNLNESQCFVSENSKQFIVVLYNPSSRNSTRYARVPVTGTSYIVFDSNNNAKIECQITPISNSVLFLSERNSLAKYDLVFPVQLPPLGFKSYYIIKNESTPLEESAHYPTEESKKLENDNFNDVNFKFKASFYCGNVDSNAMPEMRSSGAYIFRPEGDAIDLPLTYYETIKGPLFDQHSYDFDNWVHLTAREYKGLDHIEMDWVVGPIPTSGLCSGKEVVFRYKTNLASNNNFFTDSNGREMIERILNQRKTWKVSIAEPVSGNYYPVTSRIAIEDQKTRKRFVVLTDRSEGGSSLEEGSIELMVHRRLLRDDSFGVEEPLNEQDLNHNGLTVRGTHYLLVGKREEIIAAEKELAQNALLAPWYFFAKAEHLSRKTFSNLYQTQFSGLRNPKLFPKNLQILTLEPWRNDVLFRIEHIFEKDEHPTLSNQICINIQYLFSTFDVVSMKETMLAANQWKEDSKRLKWKEKKSQKSSSKFIPNLNKLICERPFDVKLNPMEIRTFILTIKATS